MVIPGHVVVTGVSGTSDCSATTAADSRPHPGLVELLNVANTTPRRRRGLPWLVSDVRRSMDVEMPIMLWTSSVTRVNPVSCAQWSSPESVIPQRNSATSPRRHRQEMIVTPRVTAAGGSGPRAGSSGPEEHEFVRINPGVRPSTFPFPWFTYSTPASHDRPAKEKITLRLYKQQSLRRKSVHRNVLRKDSDAGRATTFGSLTCASATSQKHVPL
jgi:hypothetical protein